MVAVQVVCIVDVIVWKMIMVRVVWGGGMGGKGERMNGTTLTARDSIIIIT